MLARAHRSLPGQDKHYRSSCSLSKMPSERTARNEGRSSNHFAVPNLSRSQECQGLIQYLQSHCQKGQLRLFGRACFQGGRRRGRRRSNVVVCTSYARIVRERVVGHAAACTCGVKKSRRDCDGGGGAVWCGAVRLMERDLTMLLSDRDASERKGERMCVQQKETVHEFDHPRKL